MSVWFCIPSKKPAPEAQRVIDMWRGRGYKVAIWRDLGDDPVECDYLMIGQYPGYAKAVNSLAHDVLRFDSGCDWIVTGGDDTEPEQLVAPDEIARQCTAHFKGTYGVMQPTGDRWGESPNDPNRTMRGAYIDRVAGSPWLGREWCQLAHHGQGPLHPDFFHMFVDEALQGAAQAQGCFLQRPDLTHYHRHWARTHGQREIPWYLRTVNGNSHWNQAKAIFERVKRGGFAECLP
jgi:hypothetical protein